MAFVTTRDNPPLKCYALPVPLAPCRAVALYGFLRNPTELTLSKTDTQIGRCDVSEKQQFLPSKFISFKSAPSWKRSLEKTMRESDPKKLLALVYDTEAALFIRWQEICNEERGQAEREDMKAAASDLRAIKIYKLGWPA